MWYVIFCLQNSHKNNDRMVFWLWRIEKVSGTQLKRQVIWILLISGQAWVRGNKIKTNQLTIQLDTASTLYTICVQNKWGSEAKRIHITHHTHTQWMVRGHNKGAIQNYNVSCKERQITSGWLIRRLRWSIRACFVPNESLLCYL